MTWPDPGAPFPTRWAGKVAASFSGKKSFRGKEGHAYGQRVSCLVLVLTLQQLHSYFHQNTGFTPFREHRKLLIKDGKAAFLPWKVVSPKPEPQGPLGKAGFEVGDAFLTVNDQPIPSLEALVALLGEVKPHEKVVLTAGDHRTGQMGNVEIELP